MGESTATGLPLERSDIESSIFGVGVEESTRELNPRNRSSSLRFFSRRFLRLLALLDMAAVGSKEQEIPVQAKEA